jgi:hypothetical protein
MSGARDRDVTLAPTHPELIPLSYLITIKYGDLQRELLSHPTICLQSTSVTPACTYYLRNKTKKHWQALNLVQIKRECCKAVIAIDLQVRR